MRRLVLTLVLALALVGPAQAQESIAPPGNSAIDEYSEVLPDGAGNVSTRPRGDGADTSRRRDVVPSVAAEVLRTGGADGRAVAQLARRDPEDVESSSGGTGRPATRDARIDATDPGSGVAAIGRTLTSSTDGGGVGPAPLLGALTVLIGGVAYLILRRRDRQQ